MSHTKEATVIEAQRGTIRPHQPGQDVFRSVLPEEIDWKPFAAFPPSVHLAVVVGQPSQAGPFTIRVRVPHGEKVMPHRHPEDRVYTVVSGVFTSDWAISSTPISCKPIRPVASSSYLAIHPIFTGRNPVNTSRKFRRLGRLVLNTSTRKTIRETKRS